MQIWAIVAIVSTLIVHLLLCVPSLNADLSLRFRAIKVCQSNVIELYLYIYIYMNILHMDTHIHVSLSRSLNVYVHYIYYMSDCDRQ